DSERRVSHQYSVQHRDSFIATLNKVNKQLADDSGVLVVDGHAQFTGPHSVLVTGGEEGLAITATTIIINTGSVPVIPNIPGVDSSRVIDSTGAKHLDTTPDSSVIVGVGLIRLEFRTMFSLFAPSVIL